MHILVAGSSGLVGSHLLPRLEAAGHRVTRLVRDKSRAAASGAAYWNPTTGELDPETMANAQAIINLAGDSIAAGRWNAAKKERIRASRIDTTRTLARAIAQAGGPGRVLLNASAIGFYGNRGDELLDENSASGSGDFLSGVCREWEAATESAATAGARVALLRFGVILSGEGGALAKMLLPFKLGLGGKIGSGQQYMSWIDLDDVVGAILYCLNTDSLSGPVNVVAPQPVTNAEFTKTLSRVLRRPTVFPMPAFAARAAFGQMADELLLASQRVQPARLTASGYEFVYPGLEQSLRHLLA